MKKLKFRTKLSYGLGNLGYGSMGQSVSSFIMFFGTSVLGLSGSLVGLTIAITSLWDGLSDPLVGYLSDRTRSKTFGRRLGHMLFASFALAGCNLLLWFCPLASDAGKILWILVFLLLQETFNTFFATPYSALCIDIAPDYNDQTSMQGFKTVFYIFGMIMPSILMSLLMPEGQFSRTGYMNIALVNSALVLFCGLTTVFGTRSRVRSMPNYDKALVDDISQDSQKIEENSTKNAKIMQKKCNFCENEKNCREIGKKLEENRQNLSKIQKKQEKSEKNIKKIEKKRIKIKFLSGFYVSKRNLRKKKLKNQKSHKFSSAMKTLLGGYAEVFQKENFRCVMLGYSVALVASVFVTSISMHLFTFCYGFSSTQISALMICFFSGAILSQLLWVNLIKTYDKKQTLIFALTLMLFAIAGTSVTFLFRLYTSVGTIFLWVMPCLFLCGVGSGALYSIPHSMYADVVTLDTYITGKNNAGRYTGYYTFTYNFSNSVALFVIGILLDLVKFDSSQATQSLSVQSGLGKIVFFGSAIALTVAILIFSKYSLKRSDVLKVQISKK